MITNKMVTIPFDEYMALINENNNLKTQFNALQQDYSLLLIEIEKMHQNDKTNQDIIALLKKENEQLKEVINILENRVLSLETENASLLLKISSLEHTNASLLLKISSLEDTNASLLNQINILSISIQQHEQTLKMIVDKEEYKKIVIAIQDMNRELELEKSFKNPKLLRNLRRERVQASHYIISNNISKEDDDTPEEKQYKIDILLQKLSTMSQTVRDQFDENHPRLIDMILDTVKPSKKVFDDEEMKKHVQNLWK